MSGLDLQQISKIEPYDKFLFGLNAPESKRQYPKRFQVFLNSIFQDSNDVRSQASSFYNIAKNDPDLAQELFLKFVSIQKGRVKRGEIKDITIRNYYKPTKLFCDMNNILLNWKLIAKGTPKGRQISNDRAPTLEELQTIFEYQDVRIKAIVSTMVSSGIRIGAWEYLKWKHVIPQYNEKSEVIAAKLIVYAGESEEYFSFISPEAYNCLSEWMEFRKSFGEAVNEDSWLMRDLWKTSNFSLKARNGLALDPKKLDVPGVRKILISAINQNGIRKPLGEGQKRHEFKIAHGFRKFFKSEAEQEMKPINVEILMGHSVGVSNSYYRPKEQDILCDYIKVIPLLTINIEYRLKLENEKLRIRNKDDENIIKTRFQEKEEEINDLKSQLNNVQDQINSVLFKLSKIQDEKQINQTMKLLYNVGIVKVKK